LSSFAKRIGFAGSMPSDELRDKLNADILAFFDQQLNEPKSENLTLP
jgi:hypothetical protein